MEGRLLFCGLLVLCRGQLELTIMHTNDMHSRIDEINEFKGPCSKDESGNKTCFGGVARLQTKIKEIRQQYPDSSLLMDAGDVFQGSVWSSHYKGLESSYFMNQLGYDIMALGNHEFDYGLKTLRKFIDNITFPVVDTNIDFGETELKDAVVPSHVFTIKNVKVGVLGYMTTNLPLIQSTEKIKGLTVSDEITALRDEAGKLKNDGVEIIIALGQKGYDYDLKIAEEVEDLDIVIGGQSSSFLYTGDPPSTEEPVGDYPAEVERPDGSKALVVTAYGYTKYLGNLRVTFTADGKVNGWEGQPILLDHKVAEDAALKATVEQWKGPVNELRNTVLGHTYVFLEGSSVGDKKICRERECSFGNVLADAVLWTYLKGRMPKPTDWSDVAVAVWNAGGIRTDLDQGPVTMARILVTLPYQNTVAAALVTGEIIVKMLENSVSRVGMSSGGRYLQITGMRVVYNLDKPVGQRVVSVTIRCTECLVPEYEPLENEREYKILLNSFMANGGDGYDMFPRNKVYDLGTTEGDCVRDLVVTFTPLITGIEGRIEYVEPEPEPAVCDHASSIAPTLASLLLSTLACLA